MDKKEKEDSNDQSSDQPDQPRQPTNLQGLLKFAMEATKAEDAPGSSTIEPMDPERKKFLEEALKGLSVDIVQELINSLQTLSNSESSESDQLDSLENINHYILNIDQANNFHKIGGFSVLKPCLKSQYGSVRAETASLIAELSKNNPYCQEQLLKSEMLQELTPLLSEPEPICTQAMSAISALVTNFTPGMENLFASGEINKIVAVLDSRKEDKLTTKIVFFLSAIPNCHPEFVDKFLDIGIMKYLAELIVPFAFDEGSHLRTNKLERTLMAAVSFCEHNRAVDDLRIHSKDLREKLTEIAKVAQSDEAYLEIRECAEELLKILK
ncbi:hsp70 nucleotide exchange factor FES1 [Sergentomyia squamirostris]